MKRNRFFINTGSIVFVGIILFQLLIFINWLGSSFYIVPIDQKWLSQFDKDILPSPLPEPSPNPIPPKPSPNSDKETVTWSWQDFRNNQRTISCIVPKDYLEKCTKNRENTNTYTGLYQHDVVYLSEFISKFKKMMVDSDLDYIESIGLVCSAIQSINYTLILTSRGIEYPKGSNRMLKCPCELDFGNFVAKCNSQIEGGCCNDVDPIGVYSPYEFFNKKTGDCDTRALLAYTILRKLGFDVAVMTSEKKSHSVLGIYLPNANSIGLSSGIDLSSGKKYLLWELTNKNWRFGVGQVEGYDWIVAN